MTDDPKSVTKLNPAAAERVRRRRSVAIALTLGIMVVAFYLATFVHLAGNVANRSL